MGYKLGGVNAKGDILVSDGVGNLNQLPVGADGQALIADAVSATGVKWNTPATVDVAAAVAAIPAGAVGSYQSISVGGALSYGGIYAGSSLRAGMIGSSSSASGYPAYVMATSPYLTGSWLYLGAAASGSALHFAIFKRVA